MIGAWLQFFRLRLAPTAISNVVAGVALGGWTLGSTQWLVLLTWTLVLYMVGMGFNDLVDQTRDEKTAPHRPLPSGAISVQQARAVLLLLAIPLLLLPLWMPNSAQPYAYTAIACALLYDLALKRVALVGPLLMGGVRYSIVMLGAVFAGSPQFAWSHAFTIGAFTAAITYFSEAEERGSEKTLRSRHFLIILVVVSTLLIPSGNEGGSAVATWILMLLILLFLDRGRAFRHGVSPALCTVAMLMALPLLDLRASITYSQTWIASLHLVAWLAVRPWFTLNLRSDKQ
ncbi:MAG: UbiA family prenyltransferase [Planctomycetota bacterium]|nr:UbiA family prenyltransferase [Planctomycetota bacterium]